MNIKETAKQCHQNSVNKGFWEGGKEVKNIGEMLALIHSEVSEALEAHRKDLQCKVSPSLINDIEDDQKFVEAFKENIKDTFEDELSDVAIRLFDLAAGFGIDLEGHIEAKMRFNSKREYKHGKKY